MERSGFVSAFVVPVCFLVAVLVPYTVLGDAAPLAQFISIGELGIEVMLFIVAVGFAEFFSLDALRVSALMRVVGTLLNSAGWYVASRVSFAYGVLLNSQVSLFVVLVGVEVLAVTLSVAIVKVQKVQKVRIRGMRLILILPWNLHRMTESPPIEKMGRLSVLMK